jgi:hypothetical protein
MKTVVVSGAIANKPDNGGEAWVRLSWVRGFERLGFHVVFVEQMNAPLTPPALEYYNHVVGQFELQGRSALVRVSKPRVVGMDDEQLNHVLESAELLINISGNLSAPDLLRRCRRKVFVDIDPGYTQIWREQKLIDIPAHDFYYTIGENIGRAAECRIPTGGIVWRHVRPPVVLDDWPVLPAPPTTRFTTVAAWRGSFGSATWEDRTFGQKVHEFRKFIDLPRRTPHEFELALQIHEGDAKDRTALESAGWRIVDPQHVAPDPAAFRKYVQNSSAEFSVAQGIYVDTHSGWFSDRTTRYLASGRPALVQETGFSRHVPAGNGLLSFRTIDQAVAGANEIAARYDHHRDAARAVAESYFDSDKVLTKLLDEVGVSRP